MFSLKGKTAVITGGGSGIGRAISVLFAGQGATVHILDLNEESTAETLSEIEAGGSKAFACVCNVTSQAEVLAVFEKIAGIDILVNNAGIAHIGKADTTTEADFIRVFDVNVKGAPPSSWPWPSVMLPASTCSATGRQCPPVRSWA